MAQAARIGARVASAAVMPAPVAGWNAYDPINGMKPEFAVVLDNWFPETTQLRLRRGYTGFCTSGMGSGAVETLIEYQGTNARFLACANGDIYNITGGTATSLGSGFTNNRWEWVNFTTTGGRFVIMVNGDDAPRNYNGTALATTPAITGPSNINLLWSVTSFKNQLVFAEKGTLSLWYLGTLNIGGAATEFRLAGVFRRGGQIVNVSTWSRDNSFGTSDDILAVATDQGEVALYTGAGMASIVLTGLFAFGRPLGRRCFTKFGPELVIINEDGMFPLSRLMSVDSAQNVEVSISKNIGNAVTAAARSYFANTGWQVCIYPRGNMALMNVPISATASEQYVVNTISGAWCRFTGMNASCWQVFNGELYFGATAGGAVFKADTGTSDNGANIVAVCQTAFSYLRDQTRIKRFTMVRPVFATNGALNPKIGVLTDFDVSNIGAPTASFVSTTSAWDTGRWDIATWGGSLTIQRNWIGVAAQGYAASIRMAVASNTLQATVQSFDLRYEAGGFV
jgi:hypothetical protein